MCDSIANGVRRGVLAGDIIQPFDNLFVSNSVTTTNVVATGTLTVSGAMTSNAANTTFFYDTFTIPYINTQVLNVAAVTGLTTANITTLNVQSLFANSATIYGANTLNVLGISNLNSLVLVNNLYASNALSTTNILASGNVVIGPTPTSIQANLHVENGGIFIGNSALVGATQTATGPMSRLVFDNSANTSIYPNKIVLFANTSSSQYCGFGVTSIGATGGTSIAYGSRQNHIFYTGTTLNNEVVRITAVNTVGVGTFSPAAKLHVGLTGVQNVQVLIDASNVALATTGSGRVGFGTTQPTSNLHVVGNIHASSNLSVGTAVSIPASGGETIYSRGPLIIGNGSNDGNRFISALDSSLTTGGSRYFTLGKAGSLYNQAEISYTHVADGSTSNRLDLGFFGKNVATLLATGNVGVGTPTPGAVLHVVGNVYASNALQATNVVCTSVNSTNPLGFKNRILNGDFIIDQRNAGASSTPSTGLTRVIDRWKTEIAGSGRCLVGQNLGAIASPSGLTSYFGMRVSTTTAFGAGDYFFLSQVIEGINVVDLAWGTASARPVTLSFWVYSSLTGTAGGFIRNAGESAGNYTRSYPFTYTISATNTWEQKSVTIPGDTTGQWISGQLDGPEVGFSVWNGSNFQGAPGAWGGANYTGPTGTLINWAGTLSSNLYITGMQFEPGSVATPFERRQLGFELAQCQRYFEPTMVRVGGYHTAGNFLRGSVYFNTKKRPKTSPTLSVGTQYENNNLGVLNFDNSNFDQSSARWLSNVVATGDAYGQWKVTVDCEF